MLAVKVTDTPSVILDALDIVFSDRRLAGIRFVYVRFKHEYMTSAILPIQKEAADDVTRKSFNAALIIIKRNICR